MAEEDQDQSMNPIARHNARRYAVQALYQWQLADAASDAIEAEFLNYHIIKKSVDKAYFKELLHGVPKNQKEIDAYLLPVLGRSITETDPIELAVLRLATYELMKRLDIPYRVIINEALILVKKFGSVDGYKYVNGVLDKIAKQIRVDEMAADKK